MEATDWVLSGKNVKWDASVNSDAQAQAKYGDNAKSIGKEASYKATSGKDVELHDGGKWSYSSEEPSTNENGQGNKDSSLPTLSMDNKEGVDGTSNVVTSAEFGVELVKGSARVSQSLLKMTTKSLSFAGKALGVVSLYNDGATIWNKGIKNATAADWTKLGVSSALLLFETNPAFGLAYGILDMAGKNPIDIAYGAIDTKK